MTITWVPYNAALALAAGPAAEDFRIDANVREKSPERYLSHREVSEDAQRLLTKPMYKRTFLIGPFTSKINSTLGRLNDDYIAFTRAVHQYYEDRGIDCYSSFRRERYGELGIQDSDSTTLDRLAILTSHVITVLPDSSQSNGAWKEICYAGALGRSFLFQFRKKSELKFRRIIRRLIANLSTHPSIIFITFDDTEDLFKQMDKVWSYAKREGTSDEEWERLLSSNDISLSVT